MLSLIYNHAFIITQEIQICDRDCFTLHHYF